MSANARMTFLHLQLLLQASNLHVGQHCLQDACSRPLILLLFTRMLVYCCKAVQQSLLVSVLVWLSPKSEQHLWRSAAHITSCQPLKTRLLDSLVEPQHRLSHKPADFELLHFNCAVTTV